MPETSIVIRAFNEEKHLGNLLKEIRNQDYSDYEIILVDSGSTDKTITIAKDFCSKILEIKSRDFTFGYSLNVGCKHSDGKYVVIVSAHTRPMNRHWLTALIAPFMDNNVAMVYGKQRGAQETKFSERRDFSRFFKETRLMRKDPPYYANNANSAIRKSLWEYCHFDEYLTGLEDIAWAKYQMEQGNIVVYEPRAAIYHIHEESWHQIYNRYRREAVAANGIGLPAPPHAGRSFWHFCVNIVEDVLASFPSIQIAVAKQIVQFRYYQWRGSYVGWTNKIDLQRERRDLFYSGSSQAVVISGKHDATLLELPIPARKPGDVLIKVAYVGVCQTDLEIYDQTLGYYKNKIAKYPIVPGHEFSGEVVHIGANCESIKVGDRVVGECILSGGQCNFCLAGSPVACKKRQEVGVVNHDGAYAWFLSLPAKHVNKIPDNVTLKEACLAEPLAVVRKGLSRISGRMQKKGEACAVIGAGPIGNLSAQSLIAIGHDVTVFDVNQDRLQFFEGKAQTAYTVGNLDQFDVIIEATGRLEVLRQILEESRTNVTILLLGFPYGELPYNFENVVAQEKVIVGSVGSRKEDFQWALQTLSSFDLSSFVKRTLPLNDFLKAWELHRSGKHLKIILNVWGDEMS